MMRKWYEETRREVVSTSLPFPPCRSRRKVFSTSLPFPPCGFKRRRVVRHVPGAAVVLSKLVCVLVLAQTSCLAFLHDAAGRGWVARGGRMPRMPAQRLGSTPYGAGGDAVDLSSPLITIKVIGVGGAGGNCVNGMKRTTKNLNGVEFIAMNTDVQALSSSLVETTLALGQEVTKGLGAGGMPEVGAAAAFESRDTIESLLSGADMVFITAGMGGGTGTGAAPLVAEIAKDMGILTVAVVTRPFTFEGPQRKKQAQHGLDQLMQTSDACLVVSNDRLLEIIPSDMSVEDSFLVADDILRQGVIGTSEIVLRAGMINVDFADVCSVIRNSGKALIGIGTGVGKGRAIDAAVGAICSPLLDFPITAAKGVIFNIVGGPTLSLQEVDQAAKIVQENVDEDANIIIGALIDERCGDQVSVTVLATGFEDDDAKGGKGGDDSRPQFSPASLKQKT